MNEEVYEKIDDLKKIKKDYGENMSHMCRELFPTILEKPGLLYHIISTHFSKSRYLYDDIINDSKKYDFKNYIYFLYDEMVYFNKEQKDNRTVREILSEKGYTLYECKTNEDIQKFKKYYTDGEALCTFRDPNRINNHYIFFIVKNNVDEIKRENYKNPKREDEYSTSVLDLQFDKGTRQRVSIKSRYNHTVSNPDATYSNNLENIAEGLTEAFEREYGFNIGNEYKVGFELDHYVLARNNKYYKYNYEIDNIHYCPNNIIIDDGEVIDIYLDKSRYIIIDYFLIDKQEKNIILYDSKIKDSFIDGLDNIINIEVINEDKDKNIKTIQTGGRKVIIKVDNLGRIIKYENNYLKECGYNFLYWNISLQELNLPQLRECGYNFLYWNISLQELNLPKLQRCGDNFLRWNKKLQELNLPKLQRCGDHFLCDNNTLQELNLPELQNCGYNFLCDNNTLQELNLPKLQRCEDHFLRWNKKLQELNLPKLQRCGDHFLDWNEKLQELNLPELQNCGDYFLCNNNILQELNLPKLQNCGYNFLYNNNTLQELYLPELQSYGEDFVCDRFNYDDVKGAKKV